MLPRLLYVGDVPVEASYHGSALLHRLLSDYPTGKLTVLETGTQSAPERRLDGVKYISYPIGKQRWLNTRLHPYAVAWFTKEGKRLAPTILQSVNGTGFESVLTVAHGFGWLAAARIAAERNTPLHLIVHDDWPRVADVAASFRKWLDERFASVYQQAETRLCVSPAMSRCYYERYALEANVIYPSRSIDCPEFEAPPARLSHNDRPFTIAFAGTINSNGYIQALTALQNALKPLDGRLLIFGPLTGDVARQIGLNESNTEICGLLSWAQLMTQLRERADALFVPMSFTEADRDNMQMAFPSKLADYTATGLPLLIYGPGYCSAVAWARANPDAAEVVQDQTGLAEAVQRLANDPARRVKLGARALTVGRQYFNHEQCRRVFHNAIRLK